MTAFLDERLVGFVALLAAATVAGCSWIPMPARSSSAGQVVELGDGAYSITRRSGAFGERSFALKSDAETQAFAFCAGRRLALVMLDTRSDDPDPPAYSYATVQFRCVSP